MNRIINQEKPFNPNETLKLTSLECVKEALVNEKYEICPELIQAAKDAGATRAEIQLLLARYVQMVRGIIPQIKRKSLRF